MVEAGTGETPQKDKYKKMQVLGKGAFGTALLVQSKITHKLWVIKQVDLQQMSYEERVKARDEARILQVLNHPNIISFKDVYKDKHQNLNVVMEYADGGDLKEQISKRKQANSPFTEDEVLNFFTQICLALKHCHDRKILHRDLKPQNVFLTRRGVVKLADFGISRVLNGTMSKARSIVGTPYYLSPEILQSQQYNAKTDIWSLGIILYELCAFRLPFSHPDFANLGYQIVKGKYHPLPDTYSHGVKNIIQLCLQKNPSQRPKIHDLLNMPILNRRIRSLLQDDVFKEEFAHTLLHNVNVIEEFKKL